MIKENYLKLLGQLLRDHYRAIKDTGIESQEQKQFINGYLAASKAVETTFGKAPIPVRGGGSIPICTILEKELGVKIVFMGMGLDNDNLHSPNEKYNIENYYKGIETIPYFHKYFAE